MQAISSASTWFKSGDAEDPVHTCKEVSSLDFI